MRMRRQGLSGVVLVGLELLAAGCSRLDMQDQPKYKPQRPSDFFADGRSERQPVEGTIARGTLDEDTAFYEGKDAAGKDIEAFPIAVDKAVIERGQQRFDIYCAPCHGRIGNGLGMIVRRGFKQPPSYHIDRLREAPVGHFYDVISNGYGAMLNYASQVQPRDRWAIVAYIRALQYSQNANVNDLPAEARQQSAGVGVRLRSRRRRMSRSRRPTAILPISRAKPATPSGVPGAHGAGLRGRPEANQRENDDDGTKLRDTASAERDAQEVPAHRGVRRARFSGVLVAGYFMAGPQQFLRSYLVGLWFWFGAALGCLVLLMIALSWQAARGA